MARRPRSILAEVPVHVVQRGNNRCACFFADADYRLYLHYLRELADQFRCSVHAYALMTNHVHLLLTPARCDAASLLMKNLGQRYVQHVNHRHGRTGTLWEGRFHSVVIDKESYLLRCYRYIELNPVRAQIVRHPRHYRWSSYRFNAEGAVSRFLIPHDLYCSLGACAETRRAAYRAFVGSDPSL